MKILARLGAANEQEAEQIIDAFTSFSASLKDLTGQDDPSAIIGIVAAWKQSATTDEQRKADESARVAALTADVAKAGIKTDGLAETYASSGFAAFRDEVDKRRGERAEGCDLIKSLGDSGKLSPANATVFQKLFDDHGLQALKAAASTLPKEPAVKTAPAPTVEEPDGLTDYERQTMVGMNDEQKKKFLAIRRKGRE